MNSLRLHMFATVAALVATCAIATAPAMAAAPAKEAAHNHGAAVPAKLSLDHGRKWATDETLRSGMARIHGATARAGAGRGRSQQLWEIF